MAMTMAMPQATDLPALQGTEVPYDLQEKYSSDLVDRMSGLGLWMRDRFDYEAKQRVSLEDEWLQDLRQYKGLYEPEEWRKLTDQKTRSKLFSKMTRRKVKAFDSRMMEMLFPAGKDKNWTVKPTPEPDVLMTPMAQQLLMKEQQKVVEQDVQQQMQASGLDQDTVVRRLQQGGYQPQVSPDKVREIQLSVARATSVRMEKVISDQMVDVSYKMKCQQALHSGHLYGTGIMKGPLAQIHNHPKWVNEGQWQMVMKPELQPYIEFVPVWSFYPDSASKCIEDMEYCFQRHVMTKAQVGALVKRPGFDQALLGNYLRDFPDGDCVEQSWETQIDAEDVRNDTVSERVYKRYELLEYWGTLNDAQLRGMGLEPDPLQMIWVNCWLLGPFVIRMGAVPIEGMDHPFHFYYFDKDESSFWGSGVPAVIRDDQNALNSTVRAMMDNVASTVGPQWELNTDYLPPGEKSREIYPNRIWYRRGDGRYPALRAVEVSSRLNEFLSLKGTFENQIHENTLPAYMQGQQAGGAGRTASGLSMLMGSANLDVKDQITNFDLGITRGLVRGFYLWNMHFNEDEQIKGDYEVVARGSTSLVAKEIRTQQIDQLLPLLTNPSYASYVDQRALLEEIFKARDMLDSEILLSPQAYDERKKMQQKVQQLQSELSKQMQLVELLWKAAPTLVRQAMDKVPPEAIDDYQKGKKGQSA